MPKLLLTILLTFIISIQGCSPPPVKNINAQGSSIVCFGDSITYGEGAPRSESYPSVLRSLSGERIVNAGISGETTRDALKRLNKDVFPQDPYLVLVEFGANDYIRRLPPDETISNLRKIVRDIQGRGAMVALIDVSGQYNIYHSRLKRLAKEEGCLFIPRVMQDITTDPSLTSDSFHPNARGYRIIASRVYEAIKPYIKQ